MLRTGSVLTTGWTTTAAAQWQVNNYHIEYCLTEKTPQHCKLQHSLPLAIIIIGCNFIKAAIMLFVALRMTDVPLLTTGDAIASFLQNSDDSSRGKCLLSKEEVVSGGHKQLAFSARRRWWAAAVFLRRWSFTLIS